MLPIRTILHPTDFSAYSAYAFRLACSLARDYKARLVALHVATPPIVVFGEGVVTAEPAGYPDQLRERLQRMVAQEPSVQAEPRLVEGVAATEILQRAAELKADLIVMGTHGRTGLGRLLMGSVAEQVVRKAPCPVLTVKAPQGQATAVEEPVPAVAGKAAAGQK